MGLLAVGVVAAVGATIAAVGFNDAPGNPVAGEIDIRKLDIGNYPTDPLDLRAIYKHAPTSGQQVAIGRLAGSVANGIDIDPSLKYGMRIPVPIGEASDATNILTQEVQPIVERLGLMIGFSATSSTHPLSESLVVHIPRTINAFDGETPDPASTNVNVTVLQFPDQQRAQTAADEIEAADFAVAPENVRVALDKYPSARAHWRPGVPSLGTTVSRGQYVVNVYVEQPTPDLGQLSAVTEKVLAVQLPLVDHLTPLTPRESLLQEPDPDSMLQRTLHPGNTWEPDYLTELSYTPRAYLHIVSDQGYWKKLIDDSGVDRIATASKGGQLLRARDPQAAVMLWSALRTPADKVADSPAGLTDVFCIENPKPNVSDFGQRWDANDRYYCTIRYDRYVARVAGPQLKDVHQRAAAQYALLANSQYQ
ncbi:hypothetical protein Ntsu_10550 [Nocardia sp. IFM 10818]